MKILIGLIAVCSIAFGAYAGVHDGPDVVDSGKFVPGITIHKNFGTRVFIPIVPERACLYSEGEIQTCRNRCWGSGLSVVGCSVKTINGTLTEVCTCGSQNNYARNTR